MGIILRKIIVVTDKEIDHRGVRLSVFKYTAERRTVLICPHYLRSYAVITARHRCVRTEMMNGKIQTGESHRRDVVRSPFSRCGERASDGQILFVILTGYIPNGCGPLAGSCSASHVCGYGRIAVCVGREGIRILCPDLTLYRVYGVFFKIHSGAHDRLNGRSGTLIPIDTHYRILSGRVRRHVKVGFLSGHGGFTVADTNAAARCEIFLGRVCRQR